MTFAVSSVWKGPATQTIVARNLAQARPAAAIPFEQDQEYLVYAGGEGGQLMVSLCSATKPLADAQGDIQLLGQTGTATTDLTGAAPTTTVPLANLGQFQLIALLGSIVLISLVALLIWRRRRQAVS